MLIIITMFTTIKHPPEVMLVGDIEATSLVVIMAGTGSLRVLRKCATVIVSLSRYRHKEGIDIQ